MPDASGGLLLYNAWRRVQRDRKPSDEVKVVRVLLADDQSKVRFALRVLLERRSGLKVVGEATTAEDLLVQTEMACPDLVLLGWELPGLAATSSLSALRMTCPDLLVIALSGRPEARRASLDAGADAFVSKAYPPDRLLAAIADYQSS
jgi:DNA-binding NarL/FixJ family response regulator